MLLADLYPVIKTTHVGLALLSGAMFFVRGVGVLLGLGFPLSFSVRRVTQCVDMTLLAAAVLLLIALRLNPFPTPWLLTKLALLLAYIGFGTLALRRAPTRAGKALAFVAALACFGMMVAVVRAHDPMVFLRAL